MNNRNTVVLLSTALVSIGIFLISFNCTGEFDSGALNQAHSKKKTDVVTIGLSKSQNKSFAENYAQAVKSSDAWQQGMDLNTKGQYHDAIVAFNSSLSSAESRPGKAMAYNGLAQSYAGLGDIPKQIEFMQKEADATLNKEHRADLLKKIKILKAK